MLRFELPEAAQVELFIYNALGQRVGVLAEGFRSAGVHEVTFDASGLASGMYMYELVTPGQKFIRQMLLLK